jgi:hypothetical protein
MGQISSNSNNEGSGILLNNGTSVDFKEEYSYEKLSTLSKYDLIQYIREMEIKSFNYDAEFKKILSEVIIVNEELLPISIELYEKLRKRIPFVKIESSASSLSYDKIDTYVKPKFSLDDLKKSITNEDLPVEALKSIDFGEVSTYDESAKYDCSFISLDEFNESFRLISSTKDMVGITKHILHDLADHQKLYIIAQYNKLMNNKGDPEKFNIGRATYMYKSSKMGPHDKVNSFRQIVVIPTAVNHLHRMMSIRLNKFLASQKYIDVTIQKGGVMNQSYGLYEQIFKVKKAIKIANNEKRTACVAFLDMSNAFGSLALDRMYEILEKYHVDENFIEYIKKYYNSFKYYIEAGDITFGPVEWKRGLIQGCPLSPLLFCLTIGYVLSDVAREFKDTHGFKYENKVDGLNILFSAYMDDICIITQNSEKMADVVDSLVSKLAKIGLTVNNDKSAVMFINESTPSPKISSFPSVENYKYLGEILSRDGTNDESYSQFFSELSSRLYKLDRKIFSKLNHAESNAAKSDIFYKQFLPWIQRKLMTLYDIDSSSKLKILTVIDSYTTKWSSSREMKLFTVLTNIFRGSNDSIIKKLDVSEDITLSSNIKNDISMIKSTFEENNVSFTYDSVNDSTKLDLMLDKLLN